MSDEGTPDPTYDKWPLVRKLRDAAECWRNIRNGEYKLFTEAADAIERIKAQKSQCREMLADMLGMHRSKHPSVGNWDYMLERTEEVLARTETDE